MQNISHHPENFARIFAGDGFGFVFGVCRHQVQTVAKRLIDFHRVGSVHRSDDDIAGVRREVAVDDD